MTWERGRTFAATSVTDARRRQTPRRERRPKATLRNVALREPYMHAGQMATLTDVIAHYNRAPRAPFGKTELKKLRLSATERQQLELFLRTLTATPGKHVPSVQSR